MFQRWLRRHAPPPQSRRSAPLAEWLEPRLLFSADLGAGWLPPPATDDDEEVRTLAADGEYAGAATTAAPQSLAEAYITTGLNFEQNAGQVRAGIDYLASGSGYAIALSNGDADIVLAGAQSPVHLELVGGKASVAARGEGLLDARSSYLLGNDQGKWLTDIANYRSVLYEDVYRGVDVRYYGTQRQLEYDFIVAPGAEASQIRLRFDGATARIDAGGDLLLRTPEGRELRFEAPVSYQDGPGGREAVASAYRLHADGSIGFTLGAYDRTRTLVIDPVLSYASYFGGTGVETGVDVAVDAAGSVYVTGTTNTSGLGTLLGGLLGSVLGTGTDTYVAKFNADLSNLEWTARVGGGGNDQAMAIAVTAGGSAVVTGWTTSTNFATAGAEDTSRGGPRDAFVYRLNAAGTSLAFATYNGDGGNKEAGNGVALDAAGNIYVGGTTSGNGSNTSAFVAKYNSAGELAMEQLTYGGGGSQVGNDIAVDAAGDIYLVGTSKGGSLAMPGAHQAVRAGADEGFLVRFDAAGTIVYGTYIGGTLDDTAVAVAVDGNGRAYVVGDTDESDDSGFVLTPGAWNTNRVSTMPGYLRIYDTNATGAASLKYSTLLGAADGDDALGVALRGNIVIVATRAGGDNFAVTPDAVKTTYSPDTVHIAALNPGGTGAGDLVWGSYYGAGVTGSGLAVTGTSIYVVGSTSAPGQASPGADDTAPSGRDAIVGRISLVNDAPVLDGFVGQGMLEDLPGQGFLVADLVAGELSDTDPNALLGIAITGAADAGGTWHFSQDGGTTWTALGSPAPTAALLLSADALTRLRFTPTAHANGSGASITFRGWDRTAGSAGGTANASNGGGASAFSLAEETAPFTVTAVNDQPERTAGTVANLGVPEGSTTSLGLAGLAYGAGGNGTEAGQVLTYTVTSVPSAGFGRIVLADGTTVVDGGVYSLADLRGMQFVAGTATAGTDNFAFTVRDNGGTANGGDNSLSQSLAITITNVAPVLSGSNPLPTLAEDPASATNGGMLVADLVAGRITDPGGVHGIAVVSAGTANGTWFYRRSDAGNWVALTGASVGSAVLLEADGETRLRFVPKANWNGTDTGLVFRAWDGSGDTDGDTIGNTSLTGGSRPYSAATATASITVTAVNDAPAATPVTVNGTEDTPVAITLTGTDRDGSIAAVTLATLPAQGTLYLDAARTVEATAGTYAGSSLTLYFLPARNFSGAATFTFTVVDDGGGVDPSPATARINVAAVNDAPETADVAAAGDEDATVIPVLLAGSDVDGAVTRVTILTLPTAAQGTLYTNAARTIPVEAGTSYLVGSSRVYFVPAANFNGTVTFTYAVTDNRNATDATPATATISVRPVNDAPRAGAVTVSGDEDASAIQLTLGGTDSDGTVAGVTLATLPPSAQGRLYTDAALTTLAAPGTYAGSTLTLYFVPAADFNGIAGFSYTVVDDLGLADASAATATIVVAAVNDAPATANASAGGDEDAASIAITLRANDVDSAVQGYTLQSLPANGLLYTDAARTMLATVGTLYTGTTVTLYFVPDHDFNGSTTFRFAARDAAGVDDATPATATVVVAPVNDAPVATPVTATGAEDTVIPITLAGRDVDGSPVAGITLLGLPADGLLYTDAARTTLAVAGTYAGSTLTLYFVPAVHFNGTTTFRYTVVDAQGAVDASPATATLQVTAVNDLPVTAPAAGAGMEDGSPIAVTLGGSDVEGAVHGFTLQNLPAGGLLYLDAALTTLAATGTLYAGASRTLYFVPAADFAGTTHFDVRAVDADGAVDATPARATLTVTAVNDQPVLAGGTLQDLAAPDGSAPTPLGFAGVTYTAGGGADEASQALTVTVTGLPSSLGQVLLADGTVVVEGNSYSLAQLRGMQFRATAAAGSGAASFSFTVSDDGGTAGGGDDSLQQRIAVTVVNRAPLLNGANPLPGRLEDTPAGNGMLVADLVAGRISDPQNTFGIAIVAAASPGGSWQYSRDNGATWQDFTGVAADNAVLLQADGQHRVRFVADADWSGTAGGLVFRGWDRSGGTDGMTTGDTTAHGDASPYSTATAEARITITAVNDAPVRTSGPMADLVLAEGTPATSLGLGGLAYGRGGGADEAGQGIAITVTALPPAAFGAVLLADNSAVVAGGVYTLDQLRGMKIVLSPAATGGPVTLAWRVADTGGTADGGSDTLAGESLQIRLRPNTAPVLQGANALPGLLEDALAGNGISVAGLIAGQVADRDAQAVRGIAVVQAQSPGGSWQYSTDNGATWSGFGAVSDTAARLLASDARVRFVADADWHGTAGGLVFRAWDRTGGSFSQEVGDTMANGGQAAYSAATAEARVTVTPVNDQPVQAGGTVADIVVAEGATVSLGLQGLAFGPGGAGFEAGQALTYTVTVVPGAAFGSVLLADGTVVQAGNDYTLVQLQGMRFAAASGVTTGTASFGFTVRDGGGTASGGVDSLARGMTITVVNEAPVLTGANPLPGQLEDAAAGNGVSVADLVAGKLSDPSGVLGIAVVQAQSPGGSWQYSTDNGATWSGFGAVSDTAARLLASDARVRFVADADWHGTAGGLVFRAWDRTGGSFSQEVGDTTANGGQAAYSAATAEARVTVAPVNDQPVQAGGTVADIVVAEGATVSLGLQGLAFGPGGAGFEAGQALTYTVTVVPGAAFGSVLLADGTVVQAGNDYTLAQLQGMRFAAASGVTTGTASFGFTVRDGGGTADGGADSIQRSLTIAVRNQAPVLSGVEALPALLEDAADNDGMLVADLVAGHIGDPSGAYGIAVVAAASPAGTWQFSRDGGATWASLAGASATNAQLLAADGQARVRFVPAADWNGTASGLAFRAWDRSGGTAGAVTADTASHGGSTPFSDAVVQASVVVTAVNDAPLASAPVLPPVSGNDGQGAIDLGLAGLLYGPGGAQDEGTQALSLQVTTLPPASLGTLYLADGVTAVRAGVGYGVADLRGMRFVPVAGSGGGSGAIAWVVRDDGGTAGGGVDSTQGQLQLRIAAAPVTTVPSTPDLPVEPPAPSPPLSPAPAPAPVPAPAGPVPAVPAAPAAPAPAPAPVAGGTRGPAGAVTGDALVSSPPATNLMAAGPDMSFAVDRRAIPLESVRAPIAAIAERAAVQLAGFTTAGADFQVTGFNSLAGSGSRVTIEQFQQTLRSEAFLAQMDKLRDGLRDEFDLDRTVSISVAGVSLGLSVAYVLWLVRGGVLVGSYLSALPAWRLLDPLPVLARAGEEEEDEDDEPLDSAAGASPSDPLRGFA